MISYFNVVWEIYSYNSNMQKFRYAKVQIYFHFYKFIISIQKHKRIFIY
jgi:hypothetical protein